MARARAHSLTHQHSRAREGVTARDARKEQRTTPNSGTPRQPAMCPPTRCCCFELELGLKIFGGLQIAMLSFYIVMSAPHAYSTVH